MSTMNAPAGKPPQYAPTRHATALVMVLQNTYLSNDLPLNHLAQVRRTVCFVVVPHDSLTLPW